MSDAVYAIPGLMPPYPGNMISTITTPEDGSLRILLWLGTTEDEVNYDLSIPGWRHGVIKDPNYKHYGRHDHERSKLWLDFLAEAEELPENTIVPQVKNHCGYYVPLTEWCLDRNEGADTYFVLDLPPRTLPAGPTTVEAVVNGKVYRYIVQRPATALHRRPDRTPKTKKPSDMQNITLDVAPLTTSQYVFNVSRAAYARPPHGATVYAEWEDGTQTPATLCGPNLTISIPELPIGRYMFTVYYGEKPDRHSVIKGMARAAFMGNADIINEIRYDGAGNVVLCYLSTESGLDSLLNGAKFADGVYAYAPMAVSAIEAFSYSTCKEVRGTMDNLVTAVGMFRFSSVASAPVAFPSLVNAQSMFAGSKLKSGPEMPVATNLNDTFSGCTDLDTIAASYPEAVTADNVCNSCDNLRYPCDLPKSTSCKRSFIGCTLLQRISYTPLTESLVGCYKGCSLLAEVADDTSWPELQDAEDAFAGCLSLTADNVTNILNALPDRAGESHIITLPDTTAARGVDTSAAEAKGWQVEYK